MIVLVAAIVFMMLIPMLDKWARRRWADALAKREREEGR